MALGEKGAGQHGSDYKVSGNNRGKRLRDLNRKTCSHPNVAMN